MGSRTPGAPSPLRLARNLRGMEIADVARALDCSSAWVGAMELGRRPIPAATLPRLAEVLGVPVGMLTGAPVTLALESSDSDRPPPHRWVVQPSGADVVAEMDGVGVGDGET